jgi:glycosyltransferase A (GT-A) superfamily protein (DUF2064 family)/SAM-dependent methyltransferase
MKPGVLVVAKAPVPGRVKTRLAAAVGSEPAADLAAEALLDTLDAAEAAFPRQRRVLALSGDLSAASRSADLRSRLASWHVVRQHGVGLGSRLARAHRDAATVIGSGVVQVGMDTPQVTPSHLHAVARDLGGGDCDAGCDAVLGPAVDGGWWVLGVARPEWAAGLDRVPMSDPATGRATWAMLESAGATLVRSETMRDVDTLADAEVVARSAPQTRFAAAWRRLQASLPAPVTIFDEALDGAACVAHGLPSGPVELPVSTWRAGCDSSDRALVAQCDGPTLDVGCGPGRLAEGLAARGVAVLGIDVSARAVGLTRGRGVHALRRDVFDPVPGEGRWGSVLLADGNIGIGGDPARLLRRVRELLAPDGRAVVEVAAPGTALSRHRLQIEVHGRMSAPFNWAILGPEALAHLASAECLRMLRITGHGGRWFAELARVGDARCPA